MLGCANQVCLKSLAMGRPLSSYWSNVCPSLNYFFQLKKWTFAQEEGLMLPPPQQLHQIRPEYSPTTAAPRTDLVENRMGVPVVDVKQDIVTPIPQIKLAQPTIFTASSEEGPSVKHLKKTMTDFFSAASIATTNPSLILTLFFVCLLVRTGT